MENKRLFKKASFALGVAAAVVIAVAAALLCADAIDTFAADDLKEGNYCSFVIPPEFVPGSQKGLFINKNHPMESSSINYSYSDNGLDSRPTNRDRLEQQDGPLPTYTFEAVNLTKEIYQDALSEAYNNEYGTDVGYSVSSFDNITVDGYPGYRIMASFKAGDEETVHQTVYMLLSKYRTFTVTYQRADDDECEEFFEESAATIHVH